MNREEILNRPPGRMMDIAIQVEVFKEDNIVHPLYSSDISAAFKIVEFLEQKKILFQIVRVSYLQNEFVWSAEFRECFGSCRHYYADADTVPLAICRAALLAVTQPI